MDEYEEYEEYTYLSEVTNSSGQVVRLYTHSAYAMCHAIVTEEDRYAHTLWCDSVIRR